MVLLFLRSFSWKTELWVTLGDFNGKKSEIGKGNLYLTKNPLRRNEIWCAAGNHNYMSHLCAKGFSDSNLNYTVIDKISNFQEIVPYFTYSQKIVIFKSIIVTFLDQLLLPYKFCGKDM